MAHGNKHGGYAAQAKRKGEQYLLCATCGRQHPRYRTPQAALVSGPVRSGCLHWLNAALVSVLIILICVWALVEVLGNGR